MLSFRRALLVTGCLFALFLCFSGNSTDPIAYLETKILENERTSENFLHDIQHSTEQITSKLEAEIAKLNNERIILEYQVQELRRLPDPSATVLDQLKYMRPYSVATKFPAFIWQTWKHEFNDPDLDPTIKELMDSWRRINIDFVHEIFNDSNAEKLIKAWYRNVPDVVEAYVSMPEVILKADFFRYLVLFARGGVYSDADTELLKPTPNWLPSTLSPEKVGMIVGIEADLDAPDWFNHYARRVQMCQWTISAKPGHPVLRSVIARITEKTLTRKKAGTLAIGSEGKDRGGDVLEWTGPGVWTDVLYEYFNSPKVNSEQAIDWKYFAGMSEAKYVGDVLILPITSFSPGVGHMGSKSISDTMAFVHHHFEGSWKPANER